MFLSAIVQAHSDGLVEHADVANLSVGHDDVAERSTPARTSTSVVDAAAAREKRLIELPAIHRARWI